MDKQQILELGKKKLDKKGLTKEENENRFARFKKKITKLLGEGVGSIINTTFTRCLVCGCPLKRVHGQIVKYCSKSCREKRHNKKAR